MSVMRSIPMGWSDAGLALSILRFASSFTAETGGSMKNDGLLVSSRAVNISIAVPFGIQSGAIVHVGNGKGMGGPARWRPMPIGHQPLLRQFIRFLNFSTPHSAPCAIETVGSGQMSSMYAFKNSALIDAVPCPS